MNFDDNFLEKVGLSQLPDDKKADFLAQTKTELELRVGTKMGEGLSDEQITEFEGIMHNDQQVIRKVVSELSIDFRTDTIYRKLLNHYGVTEGTWEIIGEYLSIKWIQKNRPDYRSIVEQVANDLVSEIRKNAPAILKAQTAQA